MPDNRSNDAVHVGQDVNIRKPQDTKPQAFKIGIPKTVSNRAVFCVVPAAVNLDDQQRRRAVEINDEVSQRFLPLELQPVKLLPAKLYPQGDLRIGHGRAQFSRAGF